MTDTGRIASILQYVPVSRRDEPRPRRTRTPCRERRRGDHAACGPASCMPCHPRCPRGTTRCGSLRASSTRAAWGQLPPDPLIFSAGPTEAGHAVPHRETQAYRWGRASPFSHRSLPLGEVPSKKVGGTHVLGTCVPPTLRGGHQRTTICGMQSVVFHSGSTRFCQDRPSRQPER
jgi:hypothetical protein